MAFIDYANRTNRLKSFTQAPIHLKRNAKSFAVNGLFYTNIDNMLQCHRCQTLIKIGKNLTRPLRQHKRKSPQCEVASLTLHTPLLFSVIDCPNSGLQASCYFQASYRLQHYFRYPFALMSNADIDTEAIKYWNNPYNKSLKTQFFTIRAKLKENSKPFTNYDSMIQTPLSAESWFKRISLISLQYSSAQWHNLNDSSKQYFHELAMLDMKRYRAAQIEEHFLHQSLAIGFQSSTPLLITISRHKPGMKIHLVSAYIQSKLFAYKANPLIISDSDISSSTTPSDGFSSRLE